MNIENDFSDDYKALGMLTKAMITGVVLFAGISILVHYVVRPGLYFQDDYPTFLGINILAVAFLISAARFIYPRQVKKLKESNQTSREKLEKFRKILMTHLALCEFPALLAIIFFMVFGQFLFFLIVAMCVVEMAKKYPFSGKIDTIIQSNSL